jgi:hypothetical protein
VSEPVEMPSPSDVDMRALSDLCTPWCLRVVATLRIADHLHTGVTGIDELAALVGCDRRALQRVLRHLIGKGVFTEPTPGRFALNRPARQLLDGQLLMELSLDALGGRLAGAWSGLLDTVRTGRSAYADVFGLAFYQDLDAHPELAAEFDDLMATNQHGSPDPRVLIRDDWESVRVVADIGGGTGALLTQVLLAHPDLRGVLVDRPTTVARSTETFQQAGIADRVTALGQSFFDPLPTGAEVYLINSVLEDWPDPEATALLHRCAQAARPANGRVMVLGSVTAPGRKVTEHDLLMLVIPGGQQRTIDEFEALAMDAGLQVTDAATLPSGRFAVECRPA